MLKSGKEHLEGLRDGRVIYIGSERVTDVTTHAAFRNAAQTVAAIYDMKRDPANRETMTFEEDGDRHSIYYLRARTREDLQRRMIGHKYFPFMNYVMPEHVLRGADELSTYTFNTGTARHLFCRHCGIKSFYVPRSNPDGYSVNARCLDAATIEALDVERFDGRNWESSAATLAHLSRD